MPADATAPTADFRRAALLWSGGKDSALALYHARREHPGLRIDRLVTCLSEAFDRVSMHGIRRRLVEDQAATLGLPVEFVSIPSPPVTDATGPGTSFPPNDVYAAVMSAALNRLKSAGVEVVVFGDIFLEDLRAYRETLLAATGLEGHYPLWGQDTADLYDEFVALGFRAVTVCVDATRLTEQHLGRELDAAFRDSLPPDANPCGERGEYHSFCFDGPPFARPVAFTRGGVHRQPPFAFLELFSAPPA